MRGVGSQIRARMEAGARAVAGEGTRGRVRAQRDTRGRHVRGALLGWQGRGD